MLAPISPAAAPTAGAPALPRRRRRWPWVVAALLTPFVVLALVVVDLLTLRRDAATLRDVVTASSPTPWRTTVQLDLGRVTLGAAGQILAWIEQPDIDLARAGLAAVPRASVGVYRRARPAAPDATAELLRHAERTLSPQGWTRLATIVAPHETVLIYLPTAATDTTVSLCLAVIKDTELVVVSTSIDADRLGALLAHPRFRAQLPPPLRPALPRDA